MEPLTDREIEILTYVAGELGLQDILMVQGAL